MDNSLIAKQNKQGKRGNVTEFQKYIFSTWIVDLFYEKSFSSNFYRMRDKKADKKYLKQSLQDCRTDKNILIKSSPNALWFQKIPTGFQGHPRRESQWGAVRDRAGKSERGETQARWGDQLPQSWRHCGPTSVKDSKSKHFLQEQHLLCALIHFFCGQSHLNLDIISLRNSTTLMCLYPSS